MGVHAGPEIIGMPYEGHGVTDGLVLYLDAADKASYPGSGTTWYDLTGHDNFSCPNAFGASPDRVIYDTASGAASLGGSTPTSWRTTSECTIETWHYMDTPHTGCCQTIFGRYHFRLFQINQSIYFMFGLNNSGSVTYTHPAFAITDDAWHHCVATRRSGNMILRIDGVEKYNTAWNSGLDLWGSNESNGSGIESWGINSEAAHDIEYGIVKMYDRGLTDAEILYNYNSQRGRFGV